MDLNDYQLRAGTTEQDPGPGPEKVTVALLGLAGETGSLLTLYKKWLRDGDAYQIIQQRISEELGDVLWYVAAIARKAGLELSQVAEQNLQKVSERWLPSQDVGLLDDSAPLNEQLPRCFIAEFRASGQSKNQRTEIFIDGAKCGSTLTDNSYEGDDYRYHDILHLSFAAILGWSPVFRALLHRKRKSDPLTDEVEDGGRAVAIEEGLSALIFNYARHHSLLKGVSRLDWPLLRTCYEMSSHLEVSRRSLFDWECAILKAFELWRQLQANNGGIVECNLLNRTMLYRAPEHTGLR